MSRLATVGGFGINTEASEWGKQQAEELVKAHQKSCVQDDTEQQARNVIDFQSDAFRDLLFKEIQGRFDGFIENLPVATGLACTLENPNNLTIRRELLPQLELQAIYHPSQKIVVHSRETPLALKQSKRSTGEFPFCAEDKQVRVLNAGHPLDAPTLASEIIQRVVDFTRKHLLRAE